jgi:hypothetical protein
LRGHDTTFELITAKNSDSVSENARDKLALKWSDRLFKVVVNDTDGNTKHFYVSQPFTSTHQWPIGRGTRCFCAYDPDTQRCVLLKDTWRISAYIPEGETYRKLHEGGVPNISRVLACGDVGDELQRCGDENYGTLTLNWRVHVHYRIVLQDIGTP